MVSVVPKKDNGRVLILSSCGRMLLPSIIKDSRVEDVDLQSAA
jgi:hypothetical protein